MPSLGFGVLHLRSNRVGRRLCWKELALAADRRQAGPIHPLHAFLLSAPVPLYLGALLSDWAYGGSAEPQWSNFAAWLIAGAMVFTGLALLWALVALLRSRVGRRRAALLCALLVAVFGLGLVDSFVHARDAWAVMPAAPILSAIVTLLAALAAWAGYSRLGLFSGTHSGEVK
jgi:uncharacterized membrane protein